MLGLKIRRQDGEGEKTGSDGAHPDIESTSAESRINPRRIYRLGRSVAFAINDDSIEMASVSRFGSRVFLHDVKKVYVPGDAASEDHRTTFLAGVIDDYLAEHGGHSARVSLAVAGPEMVYRTFNVPQLKKSELDSAIAFELKKQLPFPLADSYRDWRRIAVVRGRRQIRVSVHAVTRRLIKDCLTPFDRLGVEVRRIYSAADVIGQLLRELPDFAEDRNYALINIERRRSHIAYYRGSNLEFCHYSSLGSSFLSQGGDKQRVEDFAELLASEIQNSLDYYVGQFAPRLSGRVYVYGDLAYAEDLIKQLSRSVGFELSQFPTGDLQLRSRLPGEEYADTLPVCLQVLAAASCDANLVNLAPPERQADRRRRQVTRIGALALAILACLLIAEWAMQRYELAWKQTYHAGLVEDIARFQASGVFSTYNRLKKQIAEDQMFLDKTRPVESHVGLVLKELSRLTPSPIRLVAVDYQRSESQNSLALQGVVRSTKIPPEVILAEYVKTLDDSPLFTGAAVSRYAKKTLRDGFQLEFSMSLAEAR